MISDFTLKGAWGHFALHASTVQTSAPFDPRSGLAYLLVVTMTMTEVVVITLTDFTFSAGAFSTLYGFSLFLAFAGLSARRYGLPRIALALEGTALPCLIGAPTAIATVLLSAVSNSFVDNWLFGLDRALGFDWIALFQFYQRHDLLTDTSRLVYSSLPLQILCLPLLLVFTRRDALLWQFITAFALASALTVCIFPFAPAFGPYILHGLEPSDLPRLFRTFPWDTGPIIEGIRSGQIRSLDHGLGGLVSMPSFHAASAVILGSVGWKIGRRAYLLVLLNVAMFFASIISGAHYLVDLIAGGLIGAGCMFLAGVVIDLPAANRAGLADEAPRKARSGIRFG